MWMKRMEDVRGIREVTPDPHTCRWTLGAWEIESLGRTVSDGLGDDAAGDLTPGGASREKGVVLGRDGRTFGTADVAFGAGTPSEKRDVGAPGAKA